MQEVGNSFGRRRLASHFVKGESVFLCPVLSVRVMSCVNES